MSGGAVCSRCHYGKHNQCQLSCGVMGGPTCTCHEYNHNSVKMNSDFQLDKGGNKS